RNTLARLDHVATFTLTRGRIIFKVIFHSGAPGPKFEKFPKINFVSHDERQAKSRSKNAAHPNAASARLQASARRLQHQDGLQHLRCWRNHLSRMEEPRTLRRRAVRFLLFRNLARARRFQGGPAKYRRESSGQGSASCRVALGTLLA